MADSFFPSELYADGVDLKTIGRYKIVSKLGQGAFGIVYLGMDPFIKRNVAIKISQPTSDTARELFFKEAQSAGRLNHPGMVAIHDVGIEKKFCYITMEYLEGETLRKYTRSHNLLPMRKVIDYMADITNALDYAHQQGIIHRDIKPANIMLLKNGMVKITDFGTAKIVDLSQTQTGVLQGTPYYMSPEQSAGEKVDKRSDIFSVGVMLFQLLTGKLPFHGATPWLLRNEILNQPHPDPREYNPEIIEPVVAIIDKSLEKDRKRRYQRASQMAAHLRQVAKTIDEAAESEEEPGDDEPALKATIEVVKSMTLKPGESFTVSGDAIIGRNIDNEIKIMDQKVSRKHGEIFVKDGKFHIRDLGSKNGVLVDGKRVSGEGMSLHDGAQIQLSSETILEFKTA
ncbi:MAG: FHA domain-containing serine/threonine-protein kinase [Pseudomonadota bacterium]